LSVENILQNLLNVFAGLATAVSVAVIIIGVVLKAKGHPKANDLMFYGFLALLTALLGYPIVKWIYGGYTPPAPPGVPANTWSLLLYTLSAVMVVTSAVYIALGRVEEGAWSFIGAVAVIGAIGLGLAFAQPTNMPAGALSVEVTASKSVLNLGEELVLSVRALDVAGYVNISVDWGDGAKESRVAGPREWAEFRHRYSIAGDAPSASFTVAVAVADLGSNRSGVNVVGVVVVNQNYCPLGFPWNAFCGFAKWVSNIPIIGSLAVLDFQRLVMSPVFPLDQESFIYQTYSNILQLSLIGFGLFLAFSIAWSVAAHEAPTGFIRSVKDAVVALTLALLAPHIYNATALIINTVSAGFVGYGYMVQGVSIAVYTAAIGLAAVVGYFIPFVAHVASIATFLMIIGNVIVTARWAIMLAIVAASPLLALAYIHPALRGAVKHVVGLLAGLMLAGPIAAIALAVLGYLLPGQHATVAVAFPIFVQIVPTVLGAFGGWVAAGMGEAAAGGIRLMGRAVSRAAGAAPLAGGRVKVAVPQPRTPARIPPARVRIPQQQVEASVPFRPIITREAVRRAGEEARMKRQAYEGIASLPEGVGAFIAEIEAERVAAERAWQRMDTFAKEVLADTRLQRAAGREAAEAARAAYEALLEEEKQKALLEAPKPEALKVHPRWEAFKAAVGELSRRAARQLWINTKGMLKEYGYGLAREMRIKIPTKYGGRRGYDTTHSQTYTEWKLST